MVYAFSMPNEFHDAVKSIFVLAIIAVVIMILLIALSLFV